MKKIDLHIHTKSTISDRPFEFDLEVLKEYVRVRNLDAIAITNHNVFDLAQYQNIIAALECQVFPGIEVDIELAHLLVIADPSDVADFSTRCGLVTGKISSREDSLSFEDFSGVFTDLAKYVLIPHYDKNPAMSKETLAKFGTRITAGEVTSPKKFIYAYRNDASLVPVCFSDSRMEKGLQKFPTRQTFLNVGALSLLALKSALGDREKVRLTVLDRPDHFEALDGRLRLSTGLNVVLGERSSGKSFTLNHIADEFGIDAKYIRQFELLERDEAQDQKKFSEYLSTNNSLVTAEFLEELKTTVNDLSTVDWAKSLHEVDEYLSNLLLKARETEREDVFSKVVLFNEALFPMVGSEVLKSLIESTLTILATTEYRSLVEKHLSFAALGTLVVDMIHTYRREYEVGLQKSVVNETITTIKNELILKSSAIPVPEIDLYTVALDSKKIENFIAVAKAASSAREINRVKLQSFQILAEVRPFSSVSDLKKISGRREGSFADAFSVYDKPYEFLLALRTIPEVPPAEYYKYFAMVEYRILNKHGFDVSGGERSEFRLLQQIADAQRFDILLIDEPESSFDNQFLKTEVNTLLKDIARHVPVVLVTHNNTVGASIKPDYIVYTRRNLTTRPATYETYSGYPTDRVLVGDNGSEIPNFEILMNCLEAGQPAYEERGRSYEALKN